MTAIRTDPQIRARIIPWLQEKFAWDPTAVLVNEMTLGHAGARADVGVINCAIHAVEIKSAGDSLSRLPHQLTAYAAVCDRCWLVTQAPHTAKAKPQLPWYWGHVHVDAEGNLEVLSEPADSPDLDPLLLASILWREELFELLKESGLARGHSKSTRVDLCRFVAVNLPLQTIRSTVIRRLKSRTEYGAPERLKEWQPLVSP